MLIEKVDNLNIAIEHEKVLDFNIRLAKLKYTIGRKILLCTIYINYHFFDFCINS